MSTTARSRRHGASAVPMVATVVVLAIVAVAALSLVTQRGSGPAEAPGAELTGEVNAMGVAVIATPGVASGVAAAGDIEVGAANWALGRVPLDVAVQPTWNLRNTGDAPVTVGEPSAEVREGCCPGPLTLGTTTLGPGEETTLTFDLAMHEGMDGWHDMVVHVPVGQEGEVLSLGVTADFRG